MRMNIVLALVALGFRILIRHRIGRRIWPAGVYARCNVGLRTVHPGSRTGGGLPHFQSQPSVAGMPQRANPFQSADGIRSLTSTSDRF